MDPFHDYYGIPWYVILGLWAAIAIGLHVYQVGFIVKLIRLGKDDNRFDWETVCLNIEEGLLKDGFKRAIEYEIMLVPNIVDISYGRGVGYKIDEVILPQEIQKISATKIRDKMRKEGKLK